MSPTPTFQRQVFACAEDAAVVQHHPANIKNVILLFMDGDPSQVDTFGAKPELQ
ncbi:MAG TPA: DUF1501 domain-containing protein [Planctomycetaceae bacterium]|nr:DUF1501 domain-containing protein [Planctomycetaceae bacterium]